MKLKVKFNKELKAGDVVATALKGVLQYAMHTDGFLRVVSTEKDFELDPQEFLPGKHFIKIGWIEVPGMGKLTVIDESDKLVVM